ncbi:hypothetical protein [Ferrimonas senticii]|uniref:hypothetical protein n=1 Tax=Ferrimonas senticii TaxID=394566 RepID=UPI0004260FB2|nr:hypothetical protein [Ferrimonas senticii]
MTKGLKQRTLLLTLLLLVASWFAVDKFAGAEFEPDQQVGWLKWIASSGQLHFVDLLELLHRPSNNNHF